MREVPAPEPGPGELLVEVAAAGLNRADLLMRRGEYAPGPEWTVPRDRVGFELAGVVRSAAGEFAVGDRVMAQTGGACADFVTVDHRLALPVPSEMDLTAAAGLPSALLTEFDALAVVAGLRAGERVLVAGATTGVGLVGVQLARALGADSVAATTRSPAKWPLLRSLGATPPSGSYDVILDHVGGPALAELVEAAAPRARIVQIGRLAGNAGRLDLETLASRRVSLIGTTFRGRPAAELRELVAAVRAHLAGAHGVRPIIDSSYDLADAERAAQRLDAPDLAGKVVLVCR